MSRVQEELLKVFETSSPSQRLDFQGVLLELSDVMQDFRFKIPPRFALVIRALGALEGTVIKIDPSFKVVARAYPHVLGQLLRDRSPEMRNILGSLLVDPTGQIRWERLERMIRAASSTSTGKQEDDEFSPDFSVNIAAVLSDALHVLYLPENGKMRRTLLKDGAVAIDHIIDELLTGQTNRRKKTHTEEESQEKSSTTTGVSPNVIGGVVGKLSSLIGAAPGPWARVAVETVHSKEGTKFCSQLVQSVSEKSSWRSVQWGIYAAGNLLNKEQRSWKTSQLKTTQQDDSNNTQSKYTK
mmetsp:Transcript_51111/g.65418  ORF Transcript_51111/g.65418 Transcript_51111/m.65418 type:complete len:298 (-) Transcript_51111:115-1008(-)